MLLEGSGVFMKMFYDKGRDAFYEKFAEPGAPVNPVAVK
jgi:hypothetical protein